MERKDPGLWYFPCEDDSGPGYGKYPDSFFVAYRHHSGDSSWNCMESVYSRISRIVHWKSPEEHYLRFKRLRIYPYSSRLDRFCEKLRHSGHWRWSTPELQKHHLKLAKELKARFKGYSALAFLRKYYPGEKDFIETIRKASRRKPYSIW